MGKRWRKVELSYLEKHAGSKSPEELAERFHTDAKTVEAKLRELRLAAGKHASAAEEEAVGHYQEGMSALYKKHWVKAGKLLASAAAGTASPELAARARQFAAVAAARQQEGEASDPYLEAVFEKNRGNLDRALEIAKAGGRSGKDSRFAYLAATVATLEGDLAAAAEHLSRAIELEPRNRGQAAHDPDLEPLREDPEHRSLFGA